MQLAIATSINYISLITNYVIELNYVHSYFARVYSNLEAILKTEELIILHNISRINISLKINLEFTRGCCRLRNE